MIVEEIKIGKKLFPVLFGNGAIAEFEELTGTSLLNEGAQLSYGATLKLTYVGLRHGHRKRGLPRAKFLESFDAFCDFWDEEGTAEALSQALTAFSRSMPKILEIQEVEEKQEQGNAPA